MSPGPAQIPAIVVAVVAIGAAASILDFRTRRIPNLLTLGSAAAGLLVLGVAGGPRGFLWGIAGWAVGLLLFLPLFALRAMGAGDVKLLAAFGAWLGPALVFWTAIYGAIAGGVLAVPLIVSRRVVRRTIGNIWALVGHWRVAGPSPHPTLTLDAPEALRMPYAFPLAIGAVAAIWLRG